MTIKESILQVLNELPPNVKLVAVSKFKPSESIREAYSCGIRDFAENRPQELFGKASELPNDIIWHFIGHLQTNKVKMVVGTAALIQSLDSLKLAYEINKEANKRSVVQDCLLQIHIAKEESKQGFSENEITDSIKEILSLSNIRICGVMGMASFVEDAEQVRREFASLKNIFDTLKAKFFQEEESFKEISMGMSGDYSIAAEQGSTIVRIGSKIFGNR